MNVDKILQLLELGKSQSSVQKGLNWLGENLDDERAEEVFEAILNMVDGEHVNLIVEWLGSDLTVASRFSSEFFKLMSLECRSKWLESARALVMSENLTLNKEDQANLASQLINEQLQLDLIPWAIDWIGENPNSSMIGVLVRSIVAVQPNDANLDRAVDWFRLNRDDWYSNVILSTILEKRVEEELTEIAINRLKARNMEKCPELILLICPLIRAGVVVPIIAEISSNITLIGATMILREAFPEAPDQFAEVLAQWLVVHRGTDANLETGAREWALNNKTQAAALKILDFLN